MKGRLRGEEVFALLGLGMSGGLLFRVWIW